MLDERLILAIGRLERAITRVEAATRAASATADPALAQRHESLRRRTAEAILRIDALLGEA